MKRYRTPSAPLWLVMALVCAVMVIDALRRLHTMAADQFAVGLTLSLALLAVSVRMPRLCVRRGPDGILVRGFWRSHELRWSEIAGFRHEGWLVVELVDGRSIAALGVWTQNYPRSYVERTATELNDFLKSAQQNGS
ncbi:PH domain-containing protein [Kitasatospora sp. NPDC059795]|uniref:PH domain-containing protein n=1 Tax=Kitasatospora sp. NPDC059795 TaxID=3346949 RepID=UPI003646BADF